jgi:hypothetical protein
MINVQWKKRNAQYLNYYEKAYWFTYYNLLSFLWCC